MYFDTGNPNLISPITDERGELIAGRQQYNRIVANERSHRTDSLTFLSGHLILGTKFCRRKEEANSLMRDIRSAERKEATVPRCRPT